MHTEHLTPTTKPHSTRPSTAAQREPAEASHPLPGPALPPIPGAAFQLRTCRSCGEEKPLRAFYKQTNCIDFYRLDCIPCTKAEARRRRAHREWHAPERRCKVCRVRQPREAFPEDRRFRSGRGRVCHGCLEERAEQLEHEGLEAPDDAIPRGSSLREKRIDLGIAIAHATCPPGHCRSREELAAYTGLTVEGIRRIEVRALEKMRTRAERLLRRLNLEEIMEEGMRL